MAATYIETQNNASRMSVPEATRWRDKLAEAFWFSVCLVLFMILGPFAAPIAVCFLFSNRLLENGMEEPESLSDGQASFR